MCGRYVTTHSADDLAETFGVDRVELDEPLAARYNVAPTTQVPAVLTRERDGGLQRRLRTLRWGLVPSWAKDRSIGARLINARAETAAEKPSFRRALARRRALLPADGFYEWYAPRGDGPGNGSKGRKQPFYLHPADGGLALAGLYEIWRDRAVADDDAPGAFLWSTTILTTSATDEVGQVHDRMPLVLDPAAWTDWLDPGLTDTGAVRDLLSVPALGTWQVHPVSTRVNDARHDGPDLVDPVML